MNPTLAELIAAAARRGFGHSFPGGVPNDEFLTLSDGRRAITVNKTKTPFLSTVHAKLVTDKDLSGRLMEQAGLPVAPKRLSEGLSDEDFAFLDRHRELIVKPNRMDRGVGVTERVRTREALSAGFAKARVHGPVILEKFLNAREYRILVIGGRAVAALERKPVVAIGDGVSTLRGLIVRMNEDPRRGPSKLNKPMRPIKIACDAIDRLRENGVDLDAVPARGEKVQLSHANHLDSGGIACDRTDDAHPSNLELAVEAARLFSIDVAGIDLMCPDIAKPIAPGDDAAILEVNPCPDIRWHIYPAEGRSRPVADAFVDYLFSARANEAPAVDGARSLAEA